MGDRKLRCAALLCAAVLTWIVYLLDQIDMSDEAQIRSDVWQCTVRCVENGKQTAECRYNCAVLYGVLP